MWKFAGLWKLACDYNINYVKGEEKGFYSGFNLKQKEAASY